MATNKEINAKINLLVDRMEQLQKVVPLLENIKDNTKEINEENKKANKTLEDTNKQVRSLSINYKALATQILAVATGIGKLTSYTDMMVSSQNVLNQTFGDTVDKVNDYVDNLSYMTGIANVDIVKKTALFGQMATSMGFATEEASLFSMQLDDLSAKLALLYGRDFNDMSKAILDAIKGESSTLTTLTGIVIKTQSLQNTLNELGLNMQASSLSGANMALLQYITIAKQVNATNADMGKIVNDVAWQKNILKNQVKELANALGNLLYPILRAILPVINAILIVITTLINMLANLFGITKRSSNLVGNNGVSAFNNYGNAIQKASEKAKRGLRSFDKLNNITTPTPTNTSGGAGGGIDPNLLATAQGLNEEMLKIKNRAQEIADAIMKWLGFEQDIDGKWKFKKVTLGTILGMLIGGGGIIWAISKILKLFGKLKNFGGLGSLLGLGGKTSEATSGFSVPSPKTVLTGIADLILIIGAITGLVEIMGALYENPRFKALLQGGIQALQDLFLGLGKIMIPLIAFSTMLTLMGTQGWAPIIGTGSFAVGIAGITGIVWTLGKIVEDDKTKTLISGGIQTLIKIFEGLEKIMIPLIAFNAMVTLMGTTGWAPFIGDLAFALGIFAIYEIVKQLGKVAEDESTKTLVNGGIDLLVDLGYGLGRFAGSLIGGVGAGLSSGLPEIGKNLSTFAENSKSFFEITSGFSSDTALGVKYLAQALLEITKANVLEGVANFFTFGLTGKSSLASFGEQLEAFAPHFKAYADAIDGINGDTVKASANSALSLAKMNEHVPKTGGWKQVFTGTNDIDKWGEKLVKFGEKLKEYSEKVTGLKSDVIQNSVNSATALTELNNKVPKTDGWKQLITGKNDIDTWGEKLVTFGSSLKKYSEKVAGLDTQVVQNSINSADSIRALAERIPYSGGVASLFTGNNSIDKFGEKVFRFGLFMHDYYIAIKDISTSKINTITSSIGTLVDIATRVKNNGVTNTLNEFGKNLYSSSNYFNNFFSTSNAQNIGYNFGKTLADNLARGFRNGSFPKLKLTNSAGTLTTYNVKAYAQGGFVDSGQMFIARENGISEMVGRIGNRTAVANNDQIVEAVASGVARANMMTKSNQKVEIIAEGDTSGLLDFITFKQKEKNRQYGF